MTHICISKLAIIRSDNGLSPDRRQAIISTDAGLLLIGPLGTNFSDILIEILTFSFKKRLRRLRNGGHVKCCLGLNVLKDENLWKIRSWYGHLFTSMEKMYLYPGQHESIYEHNVVNSNRPHTRPHTLTQEYLFAFSPNRTLVQRRAVVGSDRQPRLQYHFVVHELVKGRSIS